MDYTEINNRLDLDSQMGNVVNDYPKNDDDYLLYIRGKNSTEEFFTAFCSDVDNLGYALFNLASQNEHVKEELFNAVKALEKQKEEES